MGAEGMAGLAEHPSGAGDSPGTEPGGPRGGSYKLEPGKAWRWRVAAQGRSW